MTSCNSVRDELATAPIAIDPEIQQHVQGCPACARYAARHATLDTAMRAELRWEMPADLSARLMALALAPIAFGPAQPKRFHVVLAYLVAVLSILLALLVGWYGVSQLLAQFNFQAQLAALLALPSQALADLTQALPESRYLVDFFLRVRTQLVWLMMVALVWAMLDRWNPQVTMQRQQRA
ncbi:MAG: hypothetical protein H7Z42_08965 [Roseiflexaceae bacterium]|nr:hypothetical protein [Roseiflexaceae bacterium]